MLIKLNRDNYVYWKVLVLPAIRALELEEFINGEKVCPNKFVKVLSLNGIDKELVVNKEYSCWRRLDQFLLSWLLSTISEGLIGEVTYLKKGSSAVVDYILKVKSVGDGLRSAEEVVTDRDLLMHVLNGLGHEFDSVVVVLSSQQNTITLHKAQYLLMINEQMIAHLNATEVSSPLANFANNTYFGGKSNTRGGYNGNKGRGNGNRRRKGKCRWQNNKPPCQICGRQGHTVMQCYNRFD
ncbi:hypothetical protein ACOSP7_017196 [Xanthoceras sorbifolium]